MHSGLGFHSSLLSGRVFAVNVEQKWIFVFVETIPCLMPSNKCTNSAHTEYRWPATAHYIDPHYFHIQFQFSNEAIVEPRVFVFMIVNSYRKSNYVFMVCRHSSVYAWCVRNCATFNSLRKFEIYVHLRFNWICSLLFAEFRQILGTRMS